VGTDEPVYTLLLPGFAYHRELLALTYAGLPNHIVLKAATLNGAKALGLGDSLGSLEVNKLADLIIVNGNPLADIKHTHNIHRVITQGVEHNPKTLLKFAQGKIGPQDGNDRAQWILEIPPLRTAVK
jgi:imidazolonepropionase-like amidohydrolase